MASFCFGVNPTCSDIFGPVGFKDEDYTYLGSNDEANEVYGRSDRSLI